MLGYLEWGEDQRQFLFQMEAQILKLLFTDPASVLHPLILLPLTGQVLLLISLFQMKPRKILVFTGLGLLAVLLLLVLFTGIVSRHWWTVVSTLPFLGISTLIIIKGRKFANRE